MQRAFFALTLLILAGLAASGEARAFLGFSDGFAAVTPVDGKVVLPLAEISDGKAHYYKYEDGGRDIRFFVLKSSDGVLRAAFDACDVCYPEKKGYAQEGEFMVCRNCGRKFHASKINEVQGGCNPAPLARSLEGDTLTIAVRDIVSGARFF